MLMTSLSLQTRLKICNSNWTNSMTIHVLEGSSSALTKQKSWSSSAGATLRFPPSRRHTSGTCHRIQIPWNHSYSWWKYAHSCWEDGRQIQACHCQSLQNRWQQGYQAQEMQCYGFSRSLLWQLVCTVVKYGPHLLWQRFLRNYPNTCPSPGIPEKSLGCQEKYWWYSLRASRNRSDAHYIYRFSTSYDSGTVYS